MTKKRQSLAEILDEDHQLTTAPPAETTTEIVIQNSETRNQNSETRNQNSETRISPTILRKRKSEIQQAEIVSPKSDFVKISPTIPPEMHEKLLDISRMRRRNKEPFMISDLVREALTLWLKQKRP